MTNVKKEEKTIVASIFVINREMNGNLLMQRNCDWEEIQPFTNLMINNP